MDDDVYELMRLLVTEGFGLVAAETLAALTVGEPVLELAQPEEAEIPQRLPIADEYFEETGRYEIIPEHRQMAFAIAYLRERLTEPAFQLAEAERIAGELSDRKPIMIEIDASDRPLLQKRAGKKSIDRRPGDTHYAEKLAEALDGLIS